jgi:glutamate 5-kinase
MATIVAKIGSSSLTNALGVINKAAIAKLCAEVIELRKEGHDVVLVSSGAVSAGVAALGLTQRPTDMATLQALSAAGQSRLIQVYDNELGAAGYVAAQVLLTPYDFMIRRQYLHARQTVTRLLELGCVPVINENDAIANDELRFGDNDRLAALVGHLVQADLLVLLTDLAGLYTADPRTNPDATLVELVAADDPVLDVRAGGSGSNRGSGGMGSKLTAARIASWSGVRAVIAQAERANVLADAVHGRPGVGTVFAAHDRRLSARKLWIAFASASNGRITVDAGARDAICDRGRSLLSAGVVQVSGAFEEQDIVDICGPDGAVFARGMVTMSASTLEEAKGRRSGDLAAYIPAEAVHRDDLVLLPN